MRTPKGGFLTYGNTLRDPRVLYASGLFFFTQFDWYFSDASDLMGGNAIGENWAVFNGGANYMPKTDGALNRVHERLFLNVSPDFQEVLPTIPNPPSPMKDAQGSRLWRVRSGADYEAEYRDAQLLRQYGLDQVTIRYHENTWRDAGESFTFRLDAAPAKGGDEALRRMVTAVQGLGWRVGLYTNYTDFAPVNAFWNPDWVNRRSNGDWQRAWMRCYAPKPMIAVQMEARLAPQIQAKFGENHSYCDVHTAVTPFERVDYDARVPGAGTFRRTFECFGRLLYNEKFAHHGPVYSEGRNHWWYAGLTDGNYAQLTSASPSEEPPLVDFDLLKMHPLEMDAGMGATGMFFKSRPVNIDQFIATTLAYGHIGFLDYVNFDDGLRIYYMLQPAQKYYAMEPVERIEYDWNGKLVDTSRALITGCYRENRVHVVYQNGTEVYVNGNAQSWKVRGPSGDLELPQWGYAVWSKRGGIKAVSATLPIAGPGATPGPRRRVDLSLGNNQFYADSRGGFAFLGPLALEGSAAIKRENKIWWMIPTRACADMAFLPGLIGHKAEVDFKVIGVREDGEVGESPEVRWSRGLFHILPGSSQALKFKIEPAAFTPRLQLQSISTLAPIGKTVRVNLPDGADVEMEKAFWEIEGQRFPATGQDDASFYVPQVPAHAALGQHLWLGIPERDELLWIDFIAVDSSRPTESL